MSGSPSVDPVVLDLYKVAVEQVDRISGRRATANSYFLTINTGLAAFVGLLAAATDASSEDLPKPDE